MNCVFRRDDGAGWFDDGPGPEAPAPSRLRGAEEAAAGAQENFTNEPWRIRKLNFEYLLQYKLATIIIVLLEFNFQCQICKKMSLWVMTTPINRV